MANQDNHPPTQAMTTRDSNARMAIQQLTSAGVVAPQVRPQDARLAAQMLAEMKQSVLADSDYLWAAAGNIYTDRKKAERASGETKGHPKKSGCLKLAMAFGLRVEIVREEWAHDGGWVDVIARATHPCGASTEDLASCEKTERKGLSRHNMRATAFTRARNRAILALIGGGEVSGEELTAGGEIEAGEYVSPGPMQPYQRQRQPDQRAQAWGQAPTRQPPPEAPPQTTPGGVDTPPIEPALAQPPWAAIHAAAAELGLSHDDLHAIMHVSSLKLLDPADLRDLPGSLAMWAQADSQADLPQALAELREDLECAETLEEMRARWVAWVSPRSLSPVGMYHATLLKDKIKSQLS